MGDRELHAPPELFCRIQVRGVSGQPEDPDPVPVFLKELPRSPRRMARRAVHDQGEGRADLFQEGMNKAHKGFCRQPLAYFAYDCPGRRIDGSEHMPFHMRAKSRNLRLCAFEDPHSMCARMGIHRRFVLKDQRLLILPAHAEITGKLRLLQPFRLEVAVRGFHIREPDPMKDLPDPLCGERNMKPLSNPSGNPLDGPVAEPESLRSRGLFHRLLHLVFLLPGQGGWPSLLPVRIQAFEAMFIVGPGPFENGLVVQAEHLRDLLPAEFKPKRQCQVTLCKALVLAFPVEV